MPLPSLDIIKQASLLQCDSSANMKSNKHCEKQTQIVDYIMTRHCSVVDRCSFYLFTNLFFISIQFYFQNSIFKFTLIPISFFPFSFFQSCCFICLPVFVCGACLSANTIVALLGGCGIASSGDRGVRFKCSPSPPCNSAVPVPRARVFVCACVRVHTRATSLR